ncbi:MAG: T9SS type A sorting domain-containing protein [Bacteroidia bacterium]|nr:T9SS type A sorting domain-containing protein [Bacteroidia bacterium]
MRKIFIALCILLFAGFAAYSQTWNTDFSDSLTGYENGNLFFTHVNVYKNHLFAFGNIVKAGDTTLHLIGEWNGSCWKNPGVLGFYDAQYDYSVVHNNKFYVCGNIYAGLNGIPGLKYIAYYDGAAWHKIDSTDIDGPVNSIYWNNNNMYIAGRFWDINGITYGHVARWDGQQWHKLKNGIIDGNLEMTSISEYNGELYYFGGGLCSIDGQPMYGVVRWDGADWHNVGSGLGATVDNLLNDTVNNRLYAGGQFYVFDDTVDTWAYKGAAYWDGIKWHGMGKMGYGAMVYDLKFYRGELYAAGGFDTLGTPIRCFAKWNGTGWEQVGQGVDYAVCSMCIYNDELILGGYFTQAGGLPAQGLARLYVPPDSACIYFTPTIYTDADTFYLHNDTVSVPFFNNNSHANSWQWNFGDSGTDTVWCPVHVYHQQGVFNVMVNVTELYCNKTAQKTIMISDIFNSVQSPTSNQQPTLKIYPNPANNSITIEVNATSEFKGEVCITDIKGNPKAKYEISKNKKTITIDTSKWSKGTYSCSLIIGGKIISSKKLIVK